MAVAITGTENATEGSAFTSAAVDEFHARGFVCMRRALSAGLVDTLRAQLEQKFAECLEAIATNGVELGIGAKNGFVEIVQRHEKRFEMRYGLTEDDSSPEIEEIASTPELQEVVRGILGDDAVLVSRSLVIAEPGAGNQSWHEDGPHLTQEMHLPCHVLNVFVPLKNMTQEMGPTELRPASHFVTRKPNLWLVAVARKQWHPAERPILERGDALLFDYRVQHRGLANQSDESRPIAVLTFAKPFFRDILNFPPKRSIFDRATES